MEVKKNPRYDLEKKRSMFLQIGFLLSFVIVLMAFEYKTPVTKTAELDFDPIEEFDELVPVTVHETKPKKEIPKVQPLIMNEILLADDDDDDVTDLEIIDSQAGEDESYDISDIDDPDEEVEDTPFVRVENMPIFNPRKNKTYEEGIKDLFLTMQKKAKYPLVAQENGVQGKVFVKFVVGKTGEISNIQVVRSVDKELDQEAIRVVKSLPKFKPGMQRNKPVSVWFSGYISFVLQ
jgi:protein TonB